MNNITRQNILKIVKDNYEDIAADFDATRQKPIWPVIAEVSKTIPADAKILDVGCGNGRLSQYLPSTAEYLGVDSSEALIAIAKKNFPDKSFAIANMLDLSTLPDDHYDIIFCIAAIHHVPSNELRVKTLIEMKKKLTPGGKIYLTAWNLWGIKKFRKLLIVSAFKKIIGLNKMDFGDIVFDWKNTDGQPRSKRYYHAFSSRELKHLARQGGLTIDKLDKDAYNFYTSLK